MPKDIVDKYRMLYRKNYMKKTLRRFCGAKRFKAFDKEHQDFTNCFIVVNFNGPAHPNIYASNWIKTSPSGMKIGVIQINPQIYELPIEEQKMLLGEEWIEVMLKFAGRLGEAQKVFGKIKMAIVFNSLKRRTFWQDSPDFEICMHAALRYLMVSKPSIEELLESKHFNLTLNDLRKSVLEGSKDALEIMENFVVAFAGKWSVERELVWDRLQEILFE